MKRTSFIIILILLPILFFLWCSPDKAEQYKVGVILDGEFNAEKWGKVYPEHYESWMKTKDPKPQGMSKYRRGWDTDKVIYDRLSEFPFAALLYNGWGFGIEYNEPRGHYYAIIDQIEVDKSRTSPGGVCLACKTPYHKTLTEKKGMKYLKAPFMEALKMIPEQDRKLGPACADCHDNETMALITNKSHITRGLKMIGKKSLTRNEKRIMACAQCHMTYYVPRTKKMKVAGDVKPPWIGSKWGNISIENIIKDLMTDYQRQEWTQKVTGFKMPYIRHPEFEMFSKNSVHWNAGVSCADCHMPYKRTGSTKISDHDVTSPIKANYRACGQCHTESAEWLKKQIFVIQDRVASLIIRAGYNAASAAKLFEILHGKQAGGMSFDKKLYAKAKDAYMKSFLRIVFVSAENSTGFHNPTEATRIMGDAIAYASRSEMLLRQMLASKGVNVGEFIKLDLKKYLNNRGHRKLKFMKNQEFKDMFKLQKDFTPRNTMGI